MLNQCKTLILVAILALSSSSCIVASAAKTAVDTTVGVTKGAVKSTGKVVGAVIPDGEKKEEK